MVSMATGNMAAARGEASAVAAERCSEAHGEDGRVDVYSKSEASLFRRALLDSCGCLWRVGVRNAAAISLRGSRSFLL